MNELAKRRFRLGTISFALTALAMAGACGVANAQALPTATRSLGLSAFGGVTLMKLDYGTTYRKYKPGFAVGGDLTHLVHGIEVSIEPRFGRTSSTTDNQTYFLGNIKAGKAFHRYHPYAFGGIGYGSIVYPTGFHDNSTVYTFGPGLDYDVTSSWAVKADWQYQSWNVGRETHGFNPNGVTVAAMYRFHGRR